MSRVSLAMALAWLVACGGDDDPATASWQLVDASEPAALLSIWGTDTNDVWVTGGRTALDGEPTLLHYDGATWERVDPGQPGIDLWWAFGVPGSANVYFGGSDGTILRYDGAGFEAMETPRDTGLVFGIWGASDDDLWAVGDDPVGGAIVWHFDGTAWSEAVPDPAPRRAFKVHGQATDDAWIVGADGVTLHWQGTAFEQVDTGTASPLFSVVTLPGVAIAVGGVEGSGELYESTGGAWTTVPLTIPVAWRGAAAGTDVAFAVGEAGLVARRDAGAWSLVDQPLTNRNFHAAWVDPAGGLWAVGGDFERAPLTVDGFLAYFGTDHPQELVP